MQPYRNYSNTDEIVYKLVKAFRNDISRSDITSELTKHPNYPGLLSISDVLNNFAITNTAYSVEFDELKKLKCPYIINTSSNRGDFVLVSAVNRDVITISNEKVENYKISKEKLKDIFYGTALSVSDAVNEKDTYFLPTVVKLFKANILFITVLLLITDFVLFKTDLLSHITAAFGFLLILKILGISVSTLLLSQVINKNNVIIDKFCPASKNVDCQDILQSDAAQIFSWLSWSELGAIYFVSTFLTIIMSDYRICSLLLLISLLSLPYTVYSLYYQSYIIRKWCLLCCLIQAIFWAEFLSLVNIIGYQKIIDSSFLSNIKTKDCNDLLVTFLLVTVIWFTAKPFLIGSLQIDIVKKTLNKFKFNKDIFDSLLLNQSQLPMPDKDWSIILGNEKPKRIITLVTNPYCKPCGQTYADANELLKTNLDLQLRIVFTATGEDIDDRTLIARHLMELSKSPDKDLIIRALRFWSGLVHKDYEYFKTYFPVKTSDNSLNTIFNQSNWCKAVNIKVTPTILIDGYLIPERYTVKDLKYMLFD